jgi:hypothetical protein
MTEDVAHVRFVVELRTDSHRQALHCQQVLRLRDHDLQVIELKKRSEVRVLAQVAFHCVVEPARIEIRAHGDTSRRLAHQGRRSEECSHILC